MVEILEIVAVFQSLSHGRLFATQGLQHVKLPCPSLSPRVSSNLCPLSEWCYQTISSSPVPLSSWPSAFPNIRVFSNEWALCIRWPKYLCLNFSSSPSNEYSGLTSCKINCFGLLVVQEIFKSLLQHHNSKASILQLSAFFMVHLSHPYMTGKSIALTIWTFVGKCCACVNCSITSDSLQPRGL